jgi:hypothetical protein
MRVAVFDRLRDSFLQGPGAILPAGRSLATASPLLCQLRGSLVNIKGKSMGIAIIRP